MQISGFINDPKPFWTISSLYSEMLVYYYRVSPQTGIRGRAKLTAFSLAGPKHRPERSGMGLHVLVGCPPLGGSEV